MKDLTQGNIYKNFILFSLPIMATGFLLSMFNVLNTSLAGKLLENNAIAAIGSTSPLITLLSYATSGYTIGFSVYLAKLFGAKQYDKIRQTLYSAMVITSCVYIVLIFALVFLRNPIMDILEVDRSIRSEATIYFSIACVSLLFKLIRHFFTYFLHAIGDTFFPFIISVISSVTHICLSIMFIKGIQGPFASVGSLALADIIAITSACVFLFYRAKKYFKMLNLNSKFNFELRSSISILHYALPCMLQQIIMYTSGFLISPMINGLGVIQLSAYSVSNQVQTLISQTFYATSKSVSNYSAQCIGAGKPEKIKKGIKACALQGILTLLPLVLIFFIFSEKISLLFFKENELSSIDYVTTFMKIYMPFTFFNVITNLFHSLFRGIKATKYLLLITFIGSLSQYIFSLLLAGRFEIYGLWTSIVLAWIVETIICIILYITGVWEKYTVNPSDISAK